ncbi:hypothetical protein VTK26DRAFT_1106 [Humicola hyalothermophila]
MILITNAQLSMDRAPGPVLHNTCLEFPTWNSSQVFIQKQSSSRLLGLVHFVPHSSTFCLGGATVAPRDASKRPISALLSRPEPRDDGTDCCQRAVFRPAASSEVKPAPLLALCVLFCNGFAGKADPSLFSTPVVTPACNTQRRTIPSKSTIVRLPPPESRVHGRICQAVDGCGDARLCWLAGHSIFFFFFFVNIIASIRMRGPEVYSFG